MENVTDVAKFIIQEREKAGCPISNMELQALLFLVQRDWVQRQPDVLFEAPFEAWMFGPVVREVYYRFCGYGALAIIPSWDPIHLDEKAENHVLTTLACFEGLGYPRLNERAMKPDRAWQTVYSHVPRVEWPDEPETPEIPIDIIRKLE